MREIKFKAFHKEEKKMYDLHALFPCDSVILLNEFGKKIIKTIEEVELMQFTGLQDVTGKDIYEGDIVKASYSIMNTEISKVEFKRGIFFVMKNGRYYPLSEFICNSKDQTKDIEIIGNIYENPDLVMSN